MKNEICPWCVTNSLGEFKLKVLKDIYECSNCGVSVKKVPSIRWEVVGYKSINKQNNSNLLGV